MGLAINGTVTLTLFKIITFQQNEMKNKNTEIVCFKIIEIEYKHVT